jgi:hypothetical protein
MNGDAERGLDIRLLRYLSTVMDAIFWGLQARKSPFTASMGGLGKYHPKLDR